MGLFYSHLIFPISSLVARMVKNLPAMRDTRFRPLGQEDPLEKEVATHSSILAWIISWTEEPGGLQLVRSQRVGHDWASNTHSSFSYFLLLFLPYSIKISWVHAAGRFSYIIAFNSFKNLWGGFLFLYCKCKQVAQGHVGNRRKSQNLTCDYRITKTMCFFCLFVLVFVSDIASKESHAFSSFCYTSLWHSQYLTANSPGWRE